jgi:hypothetical protein
VASHSSIHSSGGDVSASSTSSIPSAVIAPLSGNGGASNNDEIISFSLRRAVSVNLLHTC